MQVWCRGFSNAIGAQAIDTDDDNMLDAGNLRSGLIYEVE